MTSANGAKLEMVRAAMPTVRHSAYFNTGTAGPLARITLDALAAGNEFDATLGRGSMASFGPMLEALVELRAAFAALVGATAAEIALTHHTTDGMNIATLGLNWRPGDEIVTTSCEHPGGIVPILIVAQRFGVVIRTVELDVQDSADDIVAKFAAAITPRTRLFSFSHVLWNTGVRLPLTQLVQLAHQHNALTVVDAAQSAGALALNLPASGVDFYALTSQKWLCGPEGIGALYVRRDRLADLQLTFGGYLSLAMPSSFDMSGHMLPQPDARRFEVGTIFRPAVKAMVANLRWLEEEIGWPWIYDRIEALVSYARQALATVPGLTLITPPGAHAGLLTFTLAGYDPPRVMLALAEAGIIVRYIGAPYALRASFHFFNTEQEIERLANQLRAIAEQSPEELPVYVNPFA